jgi:hypothetical protein
MRPKGRWTGVRPAEGKEGYFEVIWPTAEPSNSRGTKMATHRGEDVVSLFKVLKSYFEGQGEKYYSPEEVDNLVREALESASSGNTHVLFPVADVQDQIRRLEERISKLEHSAQSQPPATRWTVDDPEVKSLTYEIAATHIGDARKNYKKAVGEATNKVRNRLGVSPSDTSFFKLMAEVMDKLLTQESAA